VLAGWLGSEISTVPALTEPVNRPLKPETDGRCAGLRKDADFRSCNLCVIFTSPCFVAIVESSLLGWFVLAVLLTSPKAVRFAATLRPPAPAIVDNAGLDLFLWWMVLLIGSVGGRFSSFLTRRVRVGRWGWGRHLLARWTGWMVWVC